MLVGDQRVASGLVISPAYDDPVRLALLPEDLRTGTATPFERVHLAEGITPELSMPPDATPEERVEYGRVAGKLPGLPYLGGNTWSVGLATFNAREGGSLELVGWVDE